MEAGGSTRLPRQNADKWDDHGIGANTQLMQVNLVHLLNSLWFNLMWVFERKDLTVVLIKIGEAQGRKETTHPTMYTSEAPQKTTPWMSQMLGATVGGA